MKLVSPSKLLLFSFLIWLFATISIPAKYINLGDSVFFATTSLLLFNILFLLGALSVKKSRYSVISYSVLKKRQVMFVLFILGFVGVCTRVYQRMFIQKIYFAENLVRKRMELMDAELNSGLIGVLSAAFFPFATVCLLLGILWRKDLKRIEYFLIISFGLFPIYDAFLTESRFIIILVIVMILITLSFSKLKLFRNGISIVFGKIKLLKIPKFFAKPKNLILATLLLFGFLSFSVKVINNRLAAFNFRDTLKVWERYHEVDIDDDFKIKVKSSNLEDKNKYIGVYSIKHYLAHSVYEYNRLIGNLDSYYGYYYGVYEMYVYVKIFKVLGLNIPSFSELNKVSYKPAVYTTFWGPFFIDFGVFGFVISFFLGRLSKRKYLGAKNGVETDTILYSFIGVNILASFFVSLLSGGNIFFLNAIIITIAIIKLWPNKLVIHTK